MATINRVTIRDIAKKLGISHVAVSMALKDNTRISKGRRVQVQNLARELGYRPDPILSSLANYRHGKRPVNVHSAIAWMNHWRRPGALRQIREFNAYWSGASETAERFGYRLDEFVWEPDFTAERMETILHTRNIHGILIPTTTNNLTGEAFIGRIFPSFALAYRCEARILIRSPRIIC